MIPTLAQTVADFERDIDLITAYNQWVATFKATDKSPSAFMVHQAQVAAFEKLEEVEKWLKEYGPDDMTTEARDALQEILEGRV